MLRKIGTAAFAAALALAASANVTHAQKALVYCPVSIDASGCGRIVDALTAKFPDGVERGYDGTSGTVDLRKADLQHYSVVVVPSLADNDATKPYALLRELAPAFRMAINGRVAVYSGAPDQGATNREAKNELIGNLATWAANGHTFKTGLVGLVAFLDLSSDAAERYSWVKLLSPVEVSADAELQSFSAVETMGDAGALLSKAGSPISYGNMASLGLHIGTQGAALASTGAIAGTTTRQVVLVRYSLGGVDATASGSASMSRISAGGASMSTSTSDVTASASTTNVVATLTTDRADYSPGDTVVFTGTGFGPRDTVVITVHEDPHWQDPDRTFTAIADANGSFTNRTFIVDRYDLGVTFTATAIGTPSGRTAQTTFTDGSLKLATGGTGVTVSLTLTTFSDATNCTGTSDPPVIVSASNTENTTGVGNSKSSKIQAPSLSNQGGSFINWTSTSPFTVLSTGVICVPAFNGNQTYTANYTVNANQPPVAVNDAYSTNEDAPLVVPVAGVLTNDTDPNSNSLTAVRGAGTTGPSNGTLTFNANGSFTYTPNANFNGTDSFTYFANDGTINSATAATVTITVNAVNDVPSFTKGADQTVNEDAGVQTVPGWATAISAGPANESGQTLSFVVTNTTNAALFAVVPAVASNGTLTYTPAANASGSATISLQITDDGGTTNGGVAASAVQTFVITVTSVNDAPNFLKAADQTVVEDAGAQTAAGWATGINSGPADEETQTRTFNITGNTNAALFSVAPAIDPLTGNLTYTPVANAFGTANITITLSDNGGTANGGVDTSAPQTFTITVKPVNDAPSFVKGADQTVNEDAGPQTVASWATAVSKGPANEDAQTLSFTATNTNNALFSGQPAISASGDLTYTPAPNANGSATVTVVLKDDGGNADGGVDVTASQTFTITVSPVNDAPSFTKGADETVPEDAGAKTVTGWATAISAGPADEVAQTVDFVVTNSNNGLFSAQPAIAANGTLTYTAAADAFGVATVTVHIHDNGGGTDASADQTFTISVKPVNDAPSFTKGADATVNEDAGAQTVAGWATALSRGPANENAQTLSFIVTNNNNTLFSSQPAIDASGKLTYTPAADANGAAVVTVAIKDNGGLDDGGVDTSPTQTFNITVNSVNDAPTFDLLATHTALEDAGAQSVPGALSNRLAGPANESSQTLTLSVTNDNNGLFSAQPGFDASGTLTYTPAANANGTAIVTVTLNDGGGTANGGIEATTKTLTITVTLVNDAPSFAKGADQTSLEDAGVQTVAGWATAISAGPNEGSQAVTFTTTADVPALFSVQPAIDVTGQLTYTAAPNANGSATISVVAHDNGGTLNGGVDFSAGQTFKITITPVNDAPSFTKGADQTVLEDAAAQSIGGWATALSAGPTDESGQALNFIVANNNASLFSAAPAIDASGKLTYTPAANAYGEATVTVKLHDDGGTANTGVDTSVEQTFKITIKPVNDVPSFTKGTDQTVNEDAAPQSVTGWATAISAGPNEAAQVINFVVTNDNNGLFSVQPAIDATGKLIYTPAATQFGSAIVTVQLHDNGGTSDGGIDTSAPQTFKITVASVNDAPTYYLINSHASDEDAGPQTVSNALTSASAGPSNENPALSIAISNNNTTLFSAQPSINLTTGVLTYTAVANANGTAIVQVTLKDADGTANGGVDATTKTFTITINKLNDQPAITSFSSPLAPNPVNASVTASGVFEDVDLGDSPPDTHTGTINWGDGTPVTPVSITGSTAISRNFSGSHTYAAAGVYTLIATIKDASTGAATSTYQYVVVYDPGAGFVTGGGWINSPADACLLTSGCEGATGKANFGFVSKYQKGANVPTGNTEFQFHAGNVNFKSAEYEWLVVAGARAQYKGTGTINGGGNYGFILTAIDGSINGSGGTSRFRIKIWDKNNSDKVVYDNQIGSGDDSGLTNAGTLLGGGNINIKAK